MKVLSRILAVVAWSAGTAFGQTSVAVNLAGTTLVPGTTVVRSEGPIDPSAGYRYELELTVEGIGPFIGPLIPPVTSLRNVLINAGEIPDDQLVGFLENADGGHPTADFSKTVSFTLNSPLVGAITFSFQYSGVIDETGQLQFFLGPVTSNVPSNGLFVITGSITIEHFDIPETDAQTEWRFDGGFETVSGPAQIQYLDDPAFGTPPDGAPTGMTESLSAFGTTTSFDIPDINGVEVPVFKTNPTSIHGIAGGRGFGLLLWPNSRADHPDGLIEKWTIIMDVLIPLASWDSTYPAALINLDDNNGDDAEIFIIKDPSPTIGSKFRNFETDHLQPDTWMRLAFVGDSNAGLIDIYVNGDYVGSTETADPMANRLDPDDPTYANGVGVSRDEWASWNGFPSPWALNITPVDSTITLFSDDDGEGRFFYVANLFTGDDQVDSGKLAALDQPNDRIVLCDDPCTADLDCDCDADVNDLLDFLCLWFAGAIDFNEDLAFDVTDLLDYLQQWFQGCSGD